MQAIRDTMWSGTSPLLAAALLVVVAGCTGPGSTDLASDRFLHVASRDGFVFMTQNRRPSVGMEALFTGAVVSDDAGCIRLDSEDDATVVWPKGFELDTSGDVPRVLDEGGEPVGALGEEFEFAGGEVEVLREAMGFTAEDRKLSEACPGRYWIVNDES